MTINQLANLTKDQLVEKMRIYIDDIDEGDDEDVEVGIDNLSNVLYVLKNCDYEGSEA